jgi:hypothetical protein
MRLYSEDPPICDMQTESHEHQGFTDWEVRFSMEWSELHTLHQSGPRDSLLTRVVSRISRAGAGLFELVMFEDYQG